MRFVLRLLLPFTLLPAAVTPALARIETYYIARFSAPAGRRAERREGSMVFTHTDQAAQTYCILGVYASVPGSGSPGAEFTLSRRRGHCQADQQR